MADDVMMMLPDDGGSREQMSKADKCLTRYRHSPSNEID